MPIAHFCICRLRLLYPPTRENILNALYLIYKTIIKNRCPKLNTSIPIMFKNKKKTKQKQKQKQYQTKQREKHQNISVNSYI